MTATLGLREPLRPVMRIERLAAGPDEAFAVAVAAVAGLLPVAGEDAVTQRLPVLLASWKPSELLRGFVAELLMLAERVAFCARRLERLQFRDGLRAAVSGEVLAEGATALVCVEATLAPSGGAWQLAIAIANAPHDGAHRALDE